MVQMDPEQLIKAANELFQIEDDIHGPSYEQLPFEVVEVNDTLTADGLKLGQALGEATQAWLEDRVTPTRTLITNLAEFLVAHSQEMVAVDEFTGAEFDQYAGLVDRPRQNSYTDQGLSPDGM